ncbi:borealin isoform X2 [Sceloporus undulatus]|nr:borealin isoform X2 [Sceloporus undulatus]
MAPSRKKTSRANNKNVLKSKKLDAFLNDFDQEVKERIQAIKLSSEHLQTEISHMYDSELLRLPMAVREMNWLSYCALGEGEKDLKKLALGDLDIQDITKLASEAIQTPVKTVRKAKKTKQAIETIDEEVECPVLPSRKRSRQEKETLLPGPSEQDPNMLHQSRKGKRSTKKSRPPSVRSTRFSRSTDSRNNVFTPVGQASNSTATPIQTPRFDPSMFKTPGLRPPAPQERVYSISANGSPLGHSNDVFITLPVDGGESICMKVSDLTEKDLKRLNPAALGSMRKLSSQLLRLCK